MERLTKEQISNKKLLELPEKIIQFGEGNFLRGFIDWMVHEMNKQQLFNGRIVAIQPTPHGKVVPKLNRQDGLYTLALRGIHHGEVVESNEIISSISRGINPYTDWEQVLKVAEDENVTFLFSNTTEAGLTYMKEDYNEAEAPLSFPGKVTAFLYHRYKIMNGKTKAGLTIIPCELVENNGKLLKEIVLQLSDDWNLPTDFIHWIQNENKFCNTLVDRIVTGYPTDQIQQYRSLLGYEDELLVTGEPYHLFVIDADEETAQQLPFTQAGLNVKWGDITPYRELKVRLLNGPHTMMFAACYLAGVNTVLEAMEDELLLRFLKEGLFNEIMPVVPMDEEEKNSFVHSVLERFRNPYNRHLLTDIGMNAVYKFHSRLAPIVIEYIKREGKLPKVITFSMAALMIYYRPARKEGTFLIGCRGNDEYTIRDNEEIINLFEAAWSLYDGSKEAINRVVQKLLTNTEIWGLDSTISGMLHADITSSIEAILENGIKVEMVKLVEL